MDRNADRAALQRLNDFLDEDMITRSLSRKKPRRKETSMNITSGPDDVGWDAADDTRTDHRQQLDMLERLQDWIGRMVIEVEGLEKDLAGRSTEAWRHARQGTSNLATASRQHVDAVRDAIDARVRSLHDAIEGAQQAMEKLMKSNTEPGEVTSTKVNPQNVRDARRAGQVSKIQVTEPSPSMFSTTVIKEEIAQRLERLYAFLLDCFRGIQSAVQRIQTYLGETVRRVSFHRGVSTKTVPENSHRKRKNVDATLLAAAPSSRPILDKFIFNLHLKREISRIKDLVVESRERLRDFLVRNNRMLWNVDRSPTRATKLPSSPPKDAIAMRPSEQGRPAQNTGNDTISRIDASRRAAGTDAPGIDKVKSFYHTSVTSVVSRCLHPGSWTLQLHVMDITTAITSLSVILLFGFGWIRRRRSVLERLQSSEKEMLENRRSLDAQRDRLKRALVTPSADAAVFDAVSQKKPLLHSKGKDADDDWETRVGPGTSAWEEAGRPMDDSIGDPTTWDEETRRQWRSFVRGSRLDQGEFWTDDDVDEGLPQVWVDLEKD